MEAPDSGGNTTRLVSNSVQGPYSPSFRCRARVLLSCSSQVQTSNQRRGTVSVSIVFCLSWCSLVLLLQDGVCIGDKDISVENISGHFTVSARKNRIDIILADVRAVIQMYEFKLAGKKSLVKLLGSVLSPSMVALELESKQIHIPLNFFPPTVLLYFPVIYRIN